MPKSKVGVTLRIEVRDDKGRVVKVIETPSRSFTQNFANILAASMWTEYTLTDMNIIYSFYDVTGSPIYVTGFTTTWVIVGNTAYQTPRNLNIPPGALYLYDIGAIFYSEPQYIASQYQSYTIYMPGIWPGSSFCPEPVYAHGPCSPISTSVLSPSLFSFPSSPVYTTSGWQMTYSQTWTNVTSSPVVVSSVALVFGVTGDMPTPVGYLLYAAIVDNITPAVVINPGYSVTFTYTLLYAV
jgi:hypothetical protein